MIKLIVYLAIIVAIVWFSVTVKLGTKTLVEHVRAIWHTSEVQDLKHGVEDTAGPAVDRVRRGVNAGIQAARGDGSVGLVGQQTAHDDRARAVWLRITLSQVLHCLRPGPRQ